MISPDDVGTFGGDRLDAVTAEDVLPLGEEAVGAAGDWPGVIDQTRARCGVEERADDGTGCCGGVVDSVSDGCSGIGREGVEGCGDPVPLFAGDARSAGAAPAAVVAPFAAGPVAVSGRDFVRADVDGVLDLMEVHSILPLAAIMLHSRSHYARV
jgi:hypothetical protein